MIGIGSSYPVGGPLLVTPLYFPFAFLGLGHWDPGSLVMFARIAEKFSAAAIASAAEATPIADLG